MNDFLKKAYKKIDKLNLDQVSDLMETLIRENENLTSIFESLSTGLIIVDTEWNLVHHNKASERLLHFSPDPDGNKIWSVLEDEEIADFLENCANQQKTNIREEFSIPFGESFHFVTVKIGSLVTLSGHGQTKTVAGAIITVDDVTQQRQSEILLRRMESMSRLTNLAASVAHEIKNPLGAISIHIQLLQKSVTKSRNGDGLLPDQRFMENYLGVINEEIDRLNKTVVDFLFAVRPVQANMQLANPNKILKDFVDFFSPEAENRGIELELQLCQNSPRILLDEKLFREIVINLMQNSVAAIDSAKEDSGLSGKISVKTLVKNDKFFLFFKDNGVGMDEKTMSRVFEPYYTTKATGTGLGMTTVYKIVKEFAGDIQVTSSLGKGTVFTISLPIPQKKINLLADKSDKNPGETE